MSLSSKINSCVEESKVKFTAYTFVDLAISWWNGYVKTLCLANANALFWEKLKKMIIEEYCLWKEMQQLEQEMWSLTMSDVEISTYTNRFNDLTTLCQNFVTSEYKKVERYLWDWFNPFKGWSWTLDHRHKIVLKDWLIARQNKKQDEAHWSRENKRKSCNRFKGTSKKAPSKGQETARAYTISSTLIMVTNPISQGQYMVKHPM